MAIEILPATGDRFDDAETALDSGDGPECQCQWWMLPNGPWKETSVAERTGLFRAELEGDLPPGLIAYVDGEPAGWVRVGPRTAQPRLARTRNVTGSTIEPLDDHDVWAVTCFVVRKAYRGGGLMRDLLDAAVDAARDGGARVVEGYPRDPTVAKMPVNDLYLGTVSIFEEAGFTVVGRPKPDRALVSLTLRD
ncbi:MAG: GNAT family N-acetyltransferase [Microbacterium sp. 71-36]|uniref:GNAT family N-acetyltransferase n=1 Tax=unclassified Microbacterium TaxID=2609290 RepID=UPI00086DCDB7|nr:MULTISPECIES: GNAT family N-acetyltransferase [unclassified Microbacterium]MBN9212943.1 GNAT family N-acetyltransferase [Microbacterium sp.]ODT43179.1 MAG: GNAT family N-acetyltransferase [Microbacterium sp. SCN 71-17]OJV75822.1 MAG: GNAT family N-acetyltransferase [Microbacterium sp. 71-36]